MTLTVHIPINTNTATTLTSKVEGLWDYLG